VPLIELPVPTTPAPLPARIHSLLTAADQLIDELDASGRVTAFVPSDYPGAYHVLKGLAASGLARGSRFCEWGSGFGVVTCLAAEVGFDACGIEADGELVDRARELAADFDSAAEFVHGSFVPPGAEARVHTAGNYAWMTTEADYAYEELGDDVADFDVVFAYPWPDEEHITESLFERYAGTDALYVTYHGEAGFRVRRMKKTRKRT